jgi:hypothetical protein
MRIEQDASHPAGELRIADIQLLGEVTHTNGGSRPRFERGVSKHPALGSPIYTTSHDDLELVYAPPNTSTVRIGSLAQDQTVPAYLLTDELLCKHFAILGTTAAASRAPSRWSSVRSSSTIRRDISSSWILTTNTSARSAIRPRSSAPTISTCRIGC